MSINRGKEFENRFREDWKQSFPNSFLLRLPDQVSGYKNYSKNICDFIAFTNNTLFLIECKTHAGASLPIANITQFDLIKQYVGIKGIRAGVILWLYEKDCVLYIPISTIIKLISEGKKSINPKLIDEGYNIKIIPSVKKRIFMTSDYSILVDLQENE